MNSAPPEAARGQDILNYLNAKLLPWIRRHTIVSGDYVFPQPSSAGCVLVTSPSLVGAVKYSQCAFGLNTFDHTKMRVLMNGGYVTGYGTSVQVSSAYVTIDSGTSSSPLFVYASGTSNPLTGTISATATATFPYHENTTWKMCLCALYYDATSKRIRPASPYIYHLGVIDLRTWYGP